GRGLPQIPGRGRPARRAGLARELLTDPSRDRRTDPGDAPRQRLRRAEGTRALALERDGGGARRADAIEPLQLAGPQPIEPERQPQREPGRCIELLARACEALPRDAEPAGAFRPHRAEDCRIPRQAPREHAQRQQHPYQSARPGGLRNARRGHQTSSAAAASSPSSKASWSARQASSVYFWSITTEILISEVLIIWMLMLSSARTLNILPATPAWSFMPRPTTETFAI